MSQSTTIKIKKGQPFILELYIDSIHQQSFATELTNFLRKGQWRRHVSRPKKAP
ncbi:hypothetical protein E1A91_D12G085600v1 [Gossypium mustelinum]|uniref:Uncharacterized protein n=1 Tax=Gossypium mustelinum TaxID=34275 RepID=A0A5D2SBE2_GOSMU|nr:hypothetical protein E1A91_D12G085600v1 [Gossypium mustelinum]